MNPIDEAARNLEVAKLAETLAVLRRLQAEKVLVGLLPTKLEGSVNMKGEEFKATIEYGINRTVDDAVLSNIKGEIPVDMFEQAIKYKPDVILKGLRYLQSNEPDTYAVLAQAITSKPAKPSVKVERIADEQQLAA